MPIASDHVLLTNQTCGCSGDMTCPVCDGGLAVCAVCRAAEIELDKPCWAIRVHVYIATTAQVMKEYVAACKAIEQIGPGNYKRGSPEWAALGRHGDTSIRFQDATRPERVLALLSATAALAVLVEAKNEKDARGETDRYLALKTGAWDVGRTCLEALL